MLASEDDCNVAVLYKLGQSLSRPGERAASHLVRNDSESQLEQNVQKIYVECDFPAPWSDIDILRLGWQAGVIGLKIFQDKNIWLLKYFVCQVMELSELHNPSCKLHASQSFEDHSPVRERRHSDVSDIFLSPEAYKATQAVEFIAEHLRNEDEYVQVRVKE